MNYYNENNPEAVFWLRELIRAGEIPPGDVDERSIEEVKPHELTKYTQHHFFAGIGGWALALRLAGWPDNRPVRTASCPCQPFSQTGKQLGFADKRHLWPVLFRLIEADGGGIPITVGEQVASPLGREWLAGIRADLEGLGYEVGSADLCAAGVGAPHIRQRLYWVAFAASKQRVIGSGIGGSESFAANPDAAISGGIKRLADANQRRLQAGQLDRFKVGGIDKTKSNATHNITTPPEFCESGRLANTDGGQSGDGGIQCSGEHGQQPQNDELGGLVHPDGAGRDARESAIATAGHRNTIKPTGDLDRLGHADGAGSQGRDERIFECDYQWPVGTPNLVVRCTDGKARRFEPGSFPLAHGVSGRVGLLRGYGNAIVPQLAAEFIQAAIEATEGI